MLVGCLAVSMTVAAPDYRLIGLATETDQVVEIDQSTGAAQVLFSVPFDVTTDNGFDYNPADG